MNTRPWPPSDSKPNPLPLLCCSMNWAEWKSPWTESLISINEKKSSSFIGRSISEFFSNGIKSP